jgi:hypothetical protein
MKRPLTIVAALALGLAACGTLSWTRGSATSAAPVSPKAGDPVDAALAESVRAYLHTFNLNEKELKPGLTIPFGCAGHTGGSSWDTYLVGIARATGKLGPRGHQVYEVILRMSGGEADYEGRLVEISPEPEAAPSGTLDGPPA